MRTIGLDVHRRFAEVAILDGAERRALRIDTTPEALRQFAATLRPEDQVVLEATSNTWPIADLLAARAGRVVVSNPLRTRAIADAKIKTDKVDARVLAQLLAADFIPAVWVPDAATRALRRRIAHRRALVQQRTRLRNQIHAALIRELLSPAFSDLFGRAGRRWLETAALSAEERLQVDSNLRLHDVLEAEIAQSDGALAQAALASADARLLMTIGGVGPVTALALCALIGPIARFARPNKLVGYLGLDPKVRQSGERAAWTGHISRQGQAHARGLLVEAALGAVDSAGPLRAFYLRVRARRGPQVAAVAAARKLAVIMWHLLTKRSQYRWSPSVVIAHKRRRLELTAGAPRRQRTASQGPSQRERLRDERAQCEAAEQEYRQLVRERSRAAKGTRPPPPGRDAEALEGHDARRRSSPSLRSSSRGRPRPAPNDTPAT